MSTCILGDPGVDSGGEGKSKRAENMARRKVKNGENSPWGQCLTRPVQNGRRRSDFWLVPENFNTCFKIIRIFKLAILTRLFQIQFQFVSSALSRFAKNNSLIKVCEQRTCKRSNGSINQEEKRKSIGGLLKSKYNPHGSNLLVTTLMLFFGVILFFFFISRYLMGEEGYCLTTLVTALAYLATLKPTWYLVIVLFVPLAE